MDKIKTAQELTDALLDECRQVGDNKGALKDVPEDVDSSMKDLEDYVEMEESVKPSPAMVAKIRLGIERKKRHKKMGIIEKPKTVKESDQVATAQQKDTLFDKEERMNKDKTDKDASLDPVPKTEGWVSDLVDAGKKKIKKKGDEFSKGNPKGGPVARRQAALQAAMKG